MNKLVTKIAMGTMLMGMMTVAVPATNVDAATKSCNTSKVITINNFNKSNNCNPSQNGLPSTNCNKANTQKKTFSCGNLNYQVTGANTVACTGLTAKAKNAKSCTIPKTVKCNGKTYNVTSVKANAFANCAKLNKINCKAKLTSKGKNCFGKVNCKFSA